jgi:hypothetical protein
MKKVSFLAFVSAAFLFGCSAEGSISGNATQQFDIGPGAISPTSLPTTPGGSGSPNGGNPEGGNGGFGYCSYSIYGYNISCYPIESEAERRECIDDGYDVVASCS